MTNRSNLNIGNKRPSIAIEHERELCHYAGIDWIDLFYGEKLSRVNCLGFAPDGRLVTGADHTARVWDLAHPATPAFILQGHTNWINCLGFAPDGRLVTGSADHTVHVWDLAHPAARPVVLWNVGEITCLGFAPDGRLVTGSSYGKARVWDLAHPTRPPVVLQANRRSYTCLGFAPCQPVIHKPPYRNVSSDLTAFLKFNLQRFYTVKLMKTIGHAFEKMFFFRLLRALASGHSIYW